MFTNRFFFASLCVAAGLAAQQYAIFPADHATVEGYSRTTGFPVSAGVAVQYAVYSKWDLKRSMANNTVIRKVGFRLDDNRAYTTQRIQLEIRMGHTDNFGSSLSTTFDSNFVGTPVMVFTRKLVTLPSAAAMPGPRTDHVLFDLDTNFTWDSSHNLVVEYRVFANDNGNQAFTYYCDRARHYSETERFGVSCQTSNSQTPVLTCSEANLGTNWTTSLAQGPANSASVLIIGTSNSAWNSIPLPLSLGFLGATGCDLNVAIDASLPLTTNSGGGASISIRLPKHFFLYGRKFYMQMAMADLFANSLGVITSNGASASMGINPQMTLLANFGNANATTGSLQGSELGYVSVFEY